jgi:hypothetical protein
VDDAVAGAQRNAAAVGEFFRKIRCITVDHVTPFDTIQNFIFCSFRRLPSAVIGT